MSIQDIIDLMIEPDQQLIEVYDLNKEKTIYHGDACEIDYETSQREIASIDTVEGNKITFNV